MIPFDGGPAERVVRGQQPEVLAPDRNAGQDHWTVLAPVTERGEVIGVLELLLPEEPSKEDVGEIATLATCWRSWSSPTVGTRTCSSGAIAAVR